MAKCNTCRYYMRLGEWCDVIEDSTDGDIERDCNFYIRITNGGRIRSMSDEELAEFMYGKDVPWCNDSECPSETCKDCFREWLQKEVEE